MAAGSTYTPIATTTLGSANTTVTFSSISGSYTDLILIIAATATGSRNMYLRFNGDSGSNYSITGLYGDGSAAGSYRIANDNLIQTGQVYASMTNNIFQMQNYSNTSTFKTCLNRTNSAANVTAAGVGLWRSTSAINSITLTLSAGDSFQTGSTFTLYGIAAA